MKRTLLNLLDRTKKQVWVTAYDYCTACAASQADVCAILVGDSGGMVNLGYSTTNPVTMDEMISMCQAVRRGAPKTFLIGDMPQGSYEVSDEEAVRNAMRFIKVGGVDAIKLEGCNQRIVSSIRAISQAGIVVVGHAGLTPQSSAKFGGYRVQGKTRESYISLLSNIRLLSLDCSLILIEAVPKEVGRSIYKNTIKNDTPLIGIGAGPHMDGQLLICADITGTYPNFTPSFAKCYVPQAIARAEEYSSQATSSGYNLMFSCFLEYITEVESGAFPSDEFCYHLTNAQLEDLKGYYDFTE